jgi:protein-disulfide isomerase
MALTALGCQKDDKSVEKALASIDKRLSAIEGKLASGVPTRAGATGAPGAPGAPAARQAPQPGQPDPSTVYAVPVGNSPFTGAEHAKVTIVEAFEFA